MPEADVQELLKRVRHLRDLAWRSRRIARTVPTQWVIDTMNEYAVELEEKATELERRATLLDGAANGTEADPA